MVKRRTVIKVSGAAMIPPLAGCLDDSNGDGSGDSSNAQDGPVDPSNAPRATVDRFSENAATLMIRTDDNDLPESDEPINFDQEPFLTQGFGPNGEIVKYYNFDVQLREPAPIYVLFHEGEDTPVEDQLNIVDVIPGDELYNDFWRVHRVTVPNDYEANTATSLGDINGAGYNIETTDTLVNCPVVPDGSTASMRYGDGDAGLIEGWYKGQVVSYFEFSEAPLTVSNGKVPLSPIYVAFNKNPDEEGGGPPSGFMTEAGSEQTHNVVATLPDDDGYSPLWQVNVYDNSDFGSVSDLSSATDANLLASGVATVNCPIVSHEGRSVEDGSMDNESVG